MFRRDIKQQFNVSKYRLLTNYSTISHATHASHPYRTIAGSVLLVIMGFSMTRKFQTRHKHKREPQILADGTLMPGTPRMGVSAVLQTLREMI